MKVYAKVSCELLHEHQSCLIVQQGKDAFRISKQNIKDFVVSATKCLIQVEDYICHELNIQTIK